MLNPTWLENAPDAMLKIWEQAEDEILKSMAELIEKYDFMVPSAMHQKQILEATGATQQQVAQALANITGRTHEEMQSLMTEAGNKVIEDDGKIYKQADLYKADAIDKTALNNVVETGIAQAMSEMQNITRTTANAAGTQIYKLLDNAWMQVSSGAVSYTQAIASAIKNLADGGLDSFIYPSGHVDKLDVAVRRAVVTGVNQTAGRLSNELADEVGCDLVEVSAHSGARPSHALWQGKIYSRSGESKKYPKLSTATGYGTGAGLCGWNCRHTFGPWVEGSDRVWTDKELEELNKKDYEYNGVKMTEYEASQKQRYIERQIRKYKRGEALGVDGSSDMVKKWQRTQSDFIDQTGLKRQYDRENIYSTNIAQSSPAGIAKLKERVIMTSATKKNVQASLTAFEALSGANPKYSTGEWGYTHNCQKCVQAYELRRRGYNVVAKDAIGNEFLDGWGHECFTEEDGTSLDYTWFQTRDNIANVLKAAPDGSRHFVYSLWADGNAHVFVAEKHDGYIYFVDPQSGDDNVERYFGLGVDGHFAYLRIDDKPITSELKLIRRTVEAEE